ncbi:hypothetical protein KUCAC02_008013 [Chaenocephalus aceratus]|uniref:Uncharacterized protein n=1 Tax=Chaenocephalus aceratus TaxID=36190 RepID=A0ACB9X8Z7_CHAAC|nr:hypothetical protein KUCAC02_008013 [Chaenocephalus aceratus]
MSAVPILPLNNFSLFCVLFNSSDDSQTGSIKQSRVAKTRDKQLPQDLSLEERDELSNIRRRKKELLDDMK